MKRRSMAAFGAAFTLNFIAGCAVNTPANGSKASENTTKTAPKAAPDSYAGRISLVIEPTAGSSDQTQSFSGSFELRGNAQIGELDLLTPLGQIAAQLRWQPGMAEIVRGGETQRFDSAQALLEKATGASLSLAQLFAWLQGRPTSESVGDWQVDLSAHTNGRIVARRSQPTPAVLRIILEQP
jgi:outer membrane lipoprotein LolB